MKRCRVAVLLLVLSAVGIGALVSTHPVAAGVLDYTPLEAVPGSAATGKFPEYVKALYKFALWAVGIAALFMLSIGGMMYLTSAGNTSQISTAKKVIFDAIIGLVLAIVSWLILYVINPQLIEVNLEAFKLAGNNPTNSADSGGASSVANNGAFIGTNSAPTGTAKALAQNLLPVTATNGDCVDADGNRVTPERNLNEIIAGQPITTCHNDCVATPPCNRTSNMNISILQALNDLKSSGAAFTVTSIAGGSHAPNSTHYYGNGADITVTSANTEYVTKTKGSYLCTSSAGKVYKVTGDSGTTTYFLNEDSHWHIQSTVGNLCPSS